MICEEDDHDCERSKILRPRPSPPSWMLEDKGAQGGTWGRQMTEGLKVSQREKKGSWCTPRGRVPSLQVGTRNKRIYKKPTARGKGGP